jgi:hypothetical protein
MLYRDPPSRSTAPSASRGPIAEMITPDGVVHRLSKVVDPEALRAITAKIAESALLIADGHHRYETAVRYAGEVSEAHPGAPARAEHRYFMVFLSNGDDPGLVVFPTHRHVHSLPSFSFDDLLAGARPLFDVTMLGTKDTREMLRDLDRAGKAGPAFVACAKDGRAALLCLRSDANLAAHPALSGLVPRSSGPTSPSCTAPSWRASAGSPKRPKPPRRTFTTRKMHVREEEPAPRAPRGRRRLRRRAARAPHPQRRALPRSRRSLRRGPREVVALVEDVDNLPPRSSRSSPRRIPPPTIPAQKTSTPWAAPRAS